jgi:hypothetical protein
MGDRLTFRIRRRLLARVVERSGAKDKVSVERKRRHPVRMVFERVQWPALVSRSASGFKTNVVRRTPFASHRRTVRSLEAV